MTLKEKVKLKEGKNKKRKDRKREREREKKNVKSRKIPRNLTVSRRISRNTRVLKARLVLLKVCNCDANNGHTYSQKSIARL